MMVARSQRGMVWVNQAIGGGEGEQIRFLIQLLRRPRHRALLSFGAGFKVTFELTGFEILGSKSQFRSFGVEVLVSFFRFDVFAPIFGSEMFLSKWLDRFSPWPPPTKLCGKMRFASSGTRVGHSEEPHALPDARASSWD